MDMGNFLLPVPGMKQSLLDCVGCLPTQLTVDFCRIGIRFLYVTGSAGAYFIRKLHSRYLDEFFYKLQNRDSFTRTQVKYLEWFQFVCAKHLVQSGCVCLGQDNNMNEIPEACAIGSRVVISKNDK